MKHIIHLNNNSEVLPSSEDTEKAVLWVCLCIKGVFEKYESMLHEGLFYTTVHKKILRAMKILMKEEKQIDILTAAECMQRTGDMNMKDASVTLSEITAGYYDENHAEQWIKYLIEMYLRRKIYDLMLRFGYQATDSTEDIFETIDDIKLAIDGIEIKNKISRTGTYESILDEIKQIEKRLHDKNHVHGLPSGFREVDEFTSGFQNGDMIVIAARPSMGKTAFALCCARNMTVFFNIPVLFISLEMSRKQIIHRLMGIESEINIKDIYRGRLTTDELLNIGNIMTKYRAKNLIIEDPSNVKISDIKQIIKYRIKNNGIKAVFIDYLQLIDGSTKGTNREQEISYISRNIKGMAKQMNIPMLVMSQLNRAVETRSGDHRPNLSDLRESGSIEQDADIVVFLYRPEYYGIKKDIYGNSTEGLTELIFSKGRNIGNGVVKLLFNKRLTKFNDYNNISKITDNQND